MTLWLLGGHDPTHGAGLFRDLVTARQRDRDRPRRFAVTALTRQGHGHPASAVAVPADRIVARVARWPEPSAVKIGLVPDALADTVASVLARVRAPIVLDPVLRASDGGSLGATARGLGPLLTLATLVTPNRAEAQALVADSTLEGATLARTLAARLGGPAILLKDGHGSDPGRVTDRLVQGSRISAFERPRAEGPDPRGTGCALATAIAIGLARGHALHRAVAEAIAWLDAQRLRTHPGPDGRAHLPDWRGR